jgi:hypothetical protein
MKPRIVVLNPHMSVPITTVRRQNLLGLYQEFVQQAVAKGGTPRGVDQDFAAHLEISPSMLSQIKSGRPIGDKLARQIESHCGKAADWLDREGHQSAAALDPAEERFIALARAAWRGANAKGKREMAMMLRNLLAPARD